MELIKRYGGPSDLMEEDKGELVFYEDHERIVKELEAIIQDMTDFPSSQGG